MGKGSRRVPAQVSDDQVTENWDRIFHKSDPSVHITRDMTDDMDPDNQYTQLLDLRKKEMREAHEEDRPVRCCTMFAPWTNDWELEELTKP